MAKHKMVVVNCMFFDIRSMTAARADRIVRLVPEGTDLVAATECSKQARAVLNAALERRFGAPWGWQGAQGTLTREGLNGIFFDTKVFKFQEKVGTLIDKILPSRQWTRTLVVVKLTEKKDPDAWLWAGSFHFSAVGAPYNRAQANAAKWAQVKEVLKIMGNKRALLGGDFPRTDDDDDIKLLEKEGWRLNGRTDRTPLVTMEHRNVTVLKTKIIETGSFLDHDLSVVDFSIPNIPVTEPVPPAPVTPLPDEPKAA